MPTEEDYKTARALAIEALTRLDIDDCCVKAGVSIENVSAEERRVQMSYLGQTYYLSLGRDRIFFNGEASRLKIPDQVLLLHYLITATGVPIQEKWITFREVPSGPFYYPSFVKRAISPLVRSLGEKPEMLEKVSRAMGQIVELPGDKALKVMALSRVPVILSLWRGDSEFPPEGNVYFDTSVTSYLPTEDIAYLSGAVVYAVIRVAKTLG